LAPLDFGFDRDLDLAYFTWCFECMFGFGQLFSSPRPASTSARLSFLVLGWFLHLRLLRIQYGVGIRIRLLIYTRLGLPSVVLLFFRRIRARHARSISPLRPAPAITPRPPRQPLYFWKTPHDRQFRESRA
jgi:hypothetical protein